MSWTRTTSQHNTRTALTFGSQVVIDAKSRTGDYDNFLVLKSLCDKVFHPSSRVSVFTEPLDTWVLRLSGLQREDRGRYDCHLNSDQPSKAGTPTGTGQTYVAPLKTESPFSWCQ